MPELKKQSFDLQHLEMTGEEKELRTIDAETDSGIDDPEATSGVTTDAKRRRNAARRKACICKWFSDHITAILLTYSGIVTIAAIVLSVKLDAKRDCRIDDPEPTSEVTTDANRTRNADRVKEKSRPSSAPGESSACPEPWHSCEGKCFYLSKEQGSWDMSSDSCTSLNASFAVIDTQQELESLRKFLDAGDYWIRFSKADQLWKCSNGTVCTKQFPVEGEGPCAYVNREGASSTICSVKKRYICSIPKRRKAE